MALFGPGNRANPLGRPAGTLNLRTQQAIALFEKYQFDPLEEQIKLAKSVQMATVRATNGDRMEYRKLLYLLIHDLVRYCYPQLKSVEHTGAVLHVHTTAELEAMSDIELEAHVISLRAQRQLDGTVG